MEMTWENWNPGEPNNWQNGYENCVAANFEYDLTDTYRVSQVS